jgi:hypothetical protein
MVFWMGGLAGLTRGGGRSRVGAWDKATTCPVTDRVSHKHPSSTLSHCSQLALLQFLPIFPLTPLLRSLSLINSVTHSTVAMAHSRPPSTQPMDPLDLPDYNPLGHINMLFPTSGTLASLSAVSTGLSQHTALLTKEINDKVLAQRESNAANLAGIERAKADLTELFQRIEGVAERARVTEEGITKMTGEIKRLDSGKRNLTVSMTVLKRLQMLSESSLLCDWREVLMGDSYCIRTA